MEITQGKADKVTIHLPQDLRVKLEHARIDQKTTMSAIMTDMAIKYLERPFKPKTPDRRKTRFNGLKGK